MSRDVKNRNSVVIPATPEDWFPWLEQENARSIQTYMGKPSLLIADFNREQQITHDYEGREILELLQNANDQAAEINQSGRVFVELLPEGLVFANTGQPFSTAGVASLQTSHLSPKRARRRQIIGSKGLGFRSVLNWSQTPIILSGGLRLAYSISHALARLKLLMEKSTEIEDLISEERQGSDRLILPLLPFPLYTDDGDLSAHLINDLEAQMLSRCQALIDAGYDTVIGMPFDQPQSYNAALEQIAELRPEILLFTQNLAELRFRIDSAEEQVWKLDHLDGISRVLSNNDPLGSWRVYKKSDALPEEAREPDQGKESFYEIIVAVPTGGHQAPSPLFSYFPTDIILPLPVVCHATLELEQNRKHVQQGRKGNEFVLSHIADFLAEIAEQTVKIPGKDPWAGCSLLMPLEDFPNELKRLKFPERLMKAGQSRKIIPTLGAKHTLPSQARLINGTQTSWLPPTLFADVAIVRNSKDLDFLRALGVPGLEPGVLKQRILAHPKLTLGERVALIDGMVRLQISKDEFTSALFLDKKGRKLSDKMRVFIAPSGKSKFDLPDWLDIRFLNEPMRSKLSDSLKTRDNRELQQHLADFGLLEYSLASVISALVAAANREIKNSPERAEYYEYSLLQVIFQIYSAEKQGNRRSEYPEKSPLQIKNQTGKSAPANSLYMGKGFGLQSEIVQALYENWDIERLVATPGMLGLTEKIEILKSFLLWIGVSEWPREMDLGHADSEYTKYLLGKIHYPAIFGDHICPSREEVPHAEGQNAKTIDGLKGILQNANPHAVSAWLAIDPRAPGWNQWKTNNVKLYTWPGQVRWGRLYQDALPGYIYWMLENYPWLLLSDGKRESPKNCVLVDHTIEALFPHPAMPGETELANYGIRQLDMIEGWRRAGVLTSIASLERDDIYAKLLELPNRSPDGKLARPLYQWLLDASEMAIGENGTNYKEFMSRGKMWGRFGASEGYYLISELHHADTEGIPQILLNRLKVVDLRKRVGADKVKKVFGVESIDNAGIAREVIDFNLTVGSNDANGWFQAAKPYLFKLRVSQTSQITNLQALKELNLKVCSEIKARISYKGDKTNYDVQAWDWVLQGTTLFVCADPADPIKLSPDMLADAIGEALASIFRISDGGEFARMLLCQDRDRLQLLRKMRGESAIDDLDALFADFSSFQGKKLGSASYPSAPPPQPPTHTTPPSGNASTSTDAEPKAENSEQDQSAQPKNEDIQKQGNLQIKPEEPTEVKTSSHPTLHITTISGTRTYTVVSHITDGAFCEQKAMEFEQCDTTSKPRFPLPVSHITGSAGAKCDILSFETEDARETFRTSMNGDLDTVARFIEVKGRSDKAATIELKGNELSAAEEYGERYYIYRLSELDNGDFLLTILQNPLMQKEALRPAVYVTMENAAATKRYSLSGGMLKDQEL